MSLFTNDDIDVTIDSEGDTFAMPGIDLTTASYANAIAAGVGLTSTTFAADALTKVQDAISRVAIDRAQLGAVQSRLNFTNDQLTTSKQNLSQAKSRITDVDVASESTEYARQQILVQSGTQMLREANNLPRTALELLR